MVSPRSVWGREKLRTQPPAFPRFPDLPVELQDAIWNEAARAPTIHFFALSPAIESPDGPAGRLCFPSLSRLLRRDGERPRLDPRSGYFHRAWLSMACSGSRAAVQKAYPAISPGDQPKHRIVALWWSHRAQVVRPVQLAVDFRHDIICIGPYDASSGLRGVGRMLAALSEQTQVCGLEGLEKTRRLAIEYRPEWAYTPRSTVWSRMMHCPLCGKSESFVSMVNGRFATRTCYVCLKGVLTPFLQLRRIFLAVPGLAQASPTASAHSQRFGATGATYFEADATRNVGDEAQEALQEILSRYQVARNLLLLGLLSPSTAQQRDFAELRTLHNNILQLRNLRFGFLSFHKDRQ